MTAIVRSVAGNHDWNGVVQLTTVRHLLFHHHDATQRTKRLPHLHVSRSAGTAATHPSQTK